MTISKFIEQLLDVYENEGDLEIVLKIDSNELGYEPHVVKSDVYEQFNIVKH